MARILGVIPARMAATRFPGKPLARLNGRPMIEHVYGAALACRSLDEVVIATCDEVIAEAAARFGARVVMTSPSHTRASDRVAEVAAGEPADIIVMIQGDEPMIQPGMIAAALEPFQQDPTLGCTNLAAPIRSEQELRDPNTIKVVTDAAGRALYFSRLPIPAREAQPFAASEYCKQVCVIAFRREALATFARLPEGRLERAESIDMLRFLEHGLPVRMVETAVETYAVDTEDDRRRVERLLAGVAE